MPNKPSLGSATSRKIKVSQIDRRLAELRLAYPAAATYVMQNLVDSHDTDRIASQMHNPDRAYDQQNRIQDNGPNYDNSKPTPADYARFRLVALLQMTYVGAPMIWYGDRSRHVGCRRSDLPQADALGRLEVRKAAKPRHVQDELAAYRAMIALRNSLPALRSGTFRTLLTDDGHDVWAFERVLGKEHVLVALNASDAPQEVRIPLAPNAPKSWRVVYGGSGEKAAAAGAISISVPAVGGVALQANE